MRTMLRPGALVAFIVLGACSPAEMWGDTPAPWEQVDAYYYPDRSDLTKHESARDIGSLENCRDWIFDAAARRGDPDMLRGDWECGIGPKTRSDFGGLTVYRRTVR